MIKRWSIGREVDQEAREPYLDVKRAELAVELIERSDLKPTDRIVISISVRKVRNRSKDATTDEYVIAGTLSLL